MVQPVSGGSVVGGIGDGDISCRMSGAAAVAGGDISGSPVMPCGCLCGSNPKTSIVIEAGILVSGGIFQEITGTGSIKAYISVVMECTIMHFIAESGDGSFWKVFHLKVCPGDQYVVQFIHGDMAAEDANVVILVCFLDIQLPDTAFGAGQITLVISSVKQKSFKRRVVRFRTLELDIQSTGPIRMPSAKLHGDGGICISAVDSDFGNLDVAGSAFPAGGRVDGGASCELGVSLYCEYMVVFRVAVDACSPVVTEGQKGSRFWNLESPGICMPGQVGDRNLYLAGFLQIEGIGNHVVNLKDSVFIRLS